MASIKDMVSKRLGFTKETVQQQGSPAERLKMAELTLKTNAKRIGIAEWDAPVIEVLLYLLATHCDMVRQSIYQRSGVDRTILGVDPWQQHNAGEGRLGRTLVHDLATFYGFSSGMTVDVSAASDFINAAVECGLLVRIDKEMQEWMLKSNRKPGWVIYAPEDAPTFAPNEGYKARNHFRNERTTKEALEQEPQDDTNPAGEISDKDLFPDDEEQVYQAMNGAVITTKAKDVVGKAAAGIKS